MNKKLIIIIASIVILALVIVGIFVALGSSNSGGEADELTVNGSSEKVVVVDLETGSVISEVNGDTDTSKDKDKDDSGKVPSTDNLYIFEPGSSSSQVSSGNNSSGSSSSESSSTNSSSKTESTSSVADSSSDTSSDVTSYLDREVMNGFSPWE